MRVVQLGLGPIGREVARLAAVHPAMELVGAADIDPALVGRDLGEVLQLDPRDITVEGSIGAALDGAKPKLALHCTGSRLPDVAPQLRECLERGVAVVSTCEELSYPFYRHPKLALELHDLAVRHETALLGTGVNPGFVMDKLVATLLTACTRVDRVRAVRVLDAARRRAPFVKKVGAGLTPEEFETAKDGLGHVGLAESAHLLADVVGVSTKREVRETLAPRIAEATVRAWEITVDRGRVLGVSQSVSIVEGSHERVRLEAELYVGAESPGDTVRVEGSPSLEMTLPGGVPGDEATAAVTLNCALRIDALAPGLRTVLDVPVRYDPG
jgi:4-hydroxy-tetrahydrodipicolinate reductase